MTAAEFKSKFSSEEVPFDCSKGWPTGSNLFYRCPSCGDVLPSHSEGNSRCSCRSLRIDVDYGRLSADDETKVVLLRAKQKKEPNSGGSDASQRDPWLNKPAR